MDVPDEPLSGISARTYAIDPSIANRRSMPPWRTALRSTGATCMRDFLASYVSRDWGADSIARDDPGATRL